MRILKSIILILSFFITVYITPDIQAQCSTYIQMRPAVEGCVLPVIVSTGEYLQPCSGPAEFYQLLEGDFAYIDYEDSGCLNFCQQGDEVDITCISLPVGLDDQQSFHGIKIFPTITQSKIYMQGNDIIQIGLFNDRGVLVKKLMNPNVESIDVTDLEIGMYFIQVVTKNRILVKKVIKL